jgi:hypothetical protein
MRTYLPLTLVLLLSACGAFAFDRAAPPSLFATQPSQPWATDPAAFLSSKGDKQWIIGRSDRPCLSSAEATQLACRDAARQIATMLHPLSNVPMPSANDQITSLIRAELARGQWVTERSVTRTPKPYGEIWSAMLLVDASPSTLRAIDAWFSHLQEEHRRTFVQRVTATVGLFVSILLVYAAVNTLTKGFFRGPLRAITAMSLLAAIAGFAAMASV